MDSFFALSNEKLGNVCNECKFDFYIEAENMVQRFFKYILFSRTNSNGTYRNKK